MSNDSMSSQSTQELNATEVFENVGGWVKFYRKYKVQIWFVISMFLGAIGTNADRVDSLVPDFAKFASKEEVHSVDLRVNDLELKVKHQDEDIDALTNIVQTVAEEVAKLKNK